ncbi:coproporphyrinogen-III oxidase family protein, partial [Thermodesulfobacteriota bacterium]
GIGCLPNRNSDHQDPNLRVLGRIHSAKDLSDVLKSSRKAGFHNIGLDLIYGLPGQTKDAWIEDLKRALEFEPEHLSCYMLTYEPGTPMERACRNGTISPLTEEVVAVLFETTIQFLETRGYKQYEISNFARTNATRSRHNQKYWSLIPYIGLGPAAHSFKKTCRYWNHRSVKKYVQDLETHRLPVEDKEVLTKTQRIIEALYLGLRTTSGIDRNRFEKTFGVCFQSLFGEVIADLTAKRYLKSSPAHCALTPKGMLFHESITAMLVDRIA